MNAYRLILLLLLVFGVKANARPYDYPTIRYQDARGSALGGITLPLSESVIGNLMNNPAGLARFGKFQAEFLNLHLDANGNSLSNIGSGTFSQFSMGSFKNELNSHKNDVFGLGGSVSTGFSWKGFGAGLLLQERFRAVSDGSTISYEGISQTIPTVGYGLALARGVVRLGYSLQYINQTSGTNTTSATAGPYGYMNALKQGHAFSNNASVNFIFPYTYLPTFSFMARNILGLHYFPGSFLGRSSNPTGTPSDEPMSIDAAFSFTVLMTGTTRANWYFEFNDPFGSVKMPYIDRLNTGMEVVFDRTVSLRGGLTGTRLSAGFGYQSEMSEINLAWYNDKNPLSMGGSSDTHWVLQYVLKFKEAAKRDRSTEKEK